MTKVQTCDMRCSGAMAVAGSPVPAFKPFMSK